MASNRRHLGLDSVANKDNRSPGEVAESVAWEGIWQAPSRDQQSSSDTSGSAIPTHREGGDISSDTNLHPRMRADPRI